MNIPILVGFMLVLYPHLTTVSGVNPHGKLPRLEELRLGSTIFRQGRRSWRCCREAGGVTKKRWKSTSLTIGKWWFNGGLMGFNQQNGDFNGMLPSGKLT